MEQKQQEPSGTQPEGQQQNKLGSMQAVEAVVNEFARGMARKMGVRETCFHVNLVAEIKGGDMQVIGGPLVQIQLKWPMPLGLAKAKLNGALDLIRKRGLYTPLEIATHAYFQREGLESKKWIQKQLEKLAIADVVKELIPLHRVQVIHETKVTYRDTLTGEEVSVIHKSAPQPYRSQYINEWLTLSRLANAHQVEADESTQRVVGNGATDSAVGSTTGEESEGENGGGGRVIEVLLEPDSVGTSGGAR